jgi:hypothetical protein
MGILNEIKMITGLSRNHLAEIFEVQPAQVAHWEVDPSTIPVGLLAELVQDFEEATQFLDREQLTWDQVVSYRRATMRLGVSNYMLSIMLARRDIEPLDFGCLGLWITEQELKACQKP